MPNHIFTLQPKKKESKASKSIKAYTYLTIWLFIILLVLYGINTPHNEYRDTQYYKNLRCSANYWKEVKKYKEFKRNYSKSINR